MPTAMIFASVMSAASNVYASQRQISAQRKARKWENEQMLRQEARYEKQRETEFKRQQKILTSEKEKVTAENVEAKKDLAMRRMSESFSNFRQGFL